MEQPVYTHALWRVKPGQEAAFVEAWTAMAQAFTALARPPLWGTLLRSATEPGVLYSFGPWRSAEDVEAMRADPEVQATMDRLRALCDEATPGLYHVVRHVEVGDAA
jgi:quinol monooxygenase YgiN